MLFSLGLSLVVGAINGWLVAYVEIPAIFATLAMGTLVYGFGRYFLFDLDVAYVPRGAPVSCCGWARACSLGIPVPIVLFAIVCLGGHLFLRFAKSGRLSACRRRQHRRRRGSPACRCARSSCCNMCCSALIGYGAGIITAASVASMNTRLAISTYVYDVILVVVLGGIGLSGGKGGIRNVIVGTLLIGVLLNGMTIMDVHYTVQNVVKGVILLTAIVIDTILNPRDEQTAQQGDI